MQDISESEKVNVIDMLNDIGLPIVEMEGGSLYVFDFFEPAVDGIDYTSLSGKNITKIVTEIKQVTGLNKLEEVRIVDKISNLPYRRREFHKDTKWKKYVRESNS